MKRLIAALSAAALLLASAPAFADGYNRKHHGFGYSFRHGEHFKPRHFGGFGHRFQIRPHHFRGYAFVPYFRPHVFIGPGYGRHFGPRHGGHFGPRRFGGHGFRHRH